MIAHLNQEVNGHDLHDKDLAKKGLRFRDSMGNYKMLQSHSIGYNVRKSLVLKICRVLRLFGGLALFPTFFRTFL